MQHLESASIAYAKCSCYRCGGAGDLVDMDCFIEGEGALALCLTCLIDAVAIGRPGRKRMREQGKRDREAARRAVQV